MPPTEVRAAAALVAAEPPPYEPPDSIGAPPIIGAAPPPVTADSAAPPMLLAADVAVETVVPAMLPTCDAAVVTAGFWPAAIRAAAAARVGSNSPSDGISSKLPTSFESALVTIRGGCRYARFSARMFDAAS